jgi:hypothetical protein
MPVPYRPSLLLAVAVLLPASLVAKKSAPATICVRTTELGGLDAASSERLRTAVEVGLAKHEVHVALPSDATRRSLCKSRSARARRGLLFLDVKALRVGPLIQLSVAFYRPGSQTPVIERTWSVKTNAVLSNEALSESLQKGATLAHRLAGTPRRTATEVAARQPTQSATSHGLEAASTKESAGKKVAARRPTQPAPSHEHDVAATKENTGEAEKASGSMAANLDPAAPETTQARTVEAEGGSSSPLFWASLVTMGVGAVGLSVGAGFGVKGLIHEDRASDTSNPGAQLEIPRMEESQEIANWSFLAGGTMAATGFVLWLLSDSEPDTTVALRDTAGGCMVVWGGDF